MKLTWRPRTGAEPKANPREIALTGCAYAVNCYFTQGRLQALRKRVVRATMPAGTSLYVTPTLFPVDSAGNRWMYLPNWTSMLLYDRTPNRDPIYLAAGLAMNNGTLVSGLHRFMAPTQFGFPVITRGDVDGVVGPSAGMAETAPGVATASELTKISVPAPTVAPVIAPTATPPSGTTQVWFGVYTFVYKNWLTGALMESRPSPLSNQIECTRAVPLRWTTSWDADAPMDRSADAIYAIRYYLTQGTDAAANFYLTAEQVKSPDGTFQISAYEWVISVGRLLDSTDNWAPSKDLSSIALMPSGHLVGVDGSQVVFSKASQFYAWPTDWAISLPDNPVAVGVFDNTTIVATSDRPRVYEGLSPEALQGRWIDEHLPCATPQGFVNGGSFVGWISSQGFVKISAAGVENLTAQWFTPNQWRTLTTNVDARATLWGASVVVWVGPLVNINLGEWPVSPSGRHLLIIPLDGSQPWFIATPDISTSFMAEAQDPLQSALVALQRSADGSVTLIGFDGYQDPPRLQAEKTRLEFDDIEWLSGMVQLPRDQNMGYLRITGEQLALQFELYSRGQLVATQLVHDSKKVYSLPIGRQYNALQLRITGNCRYIESIELAQRADEMGALQ